MAGFFPFHGILPDVTRTHEIASKPFDYYAQDELLDVVKRHPHSFLHVVLDALSPDSKLSHRQKLLKGKVRFDQYLHTGVYHQEKTAGYYIYRHRKDGEVLTGIVGAIPIDDVEKNIIKPHEQTIENKEIRLKEYLDVIDIHAEPVFLTFEAGDEFYTALEHVTSEPPEWKVNVEGFSEVEIWAVRKWEYISIIYQYFKKQPALYIADGHHRTASSVYYGKAQRENHPDFTGKEAFNYFLGVVFPQRSIRLREFNRLVTDLNGLSDTEFLAKLETDFQVSPVSNIENTTRLAMFLGNQWYELQLKPEQAKGLQPGNDLDTQVLSDFILSPLLGIEDLRKDKRIHFIGGKTDTHELEKLVNSKKYAAAFYVAPVPFNKFLQFANEGFFMPPKSTFFEPKLLNGMVVYSLADKEIHNYEFPA